MTAEGHSIDFTMFVFVLEFVGRVWGWIVDGFQIVMALVVDVIERRRHHHVARNRDMPELVDDDGEDQTGEPGVEVPKSTHEPTGNDPSWRTIDTIEPAFLDESQYPKDWLVYHPVLRVVLKTEADRFDRGERVGTLEASVQEMEEKKEEPSDMNNSLQNRSNSPVDDLQEYSDEEEGDKSGHDRISDSAISCPSAPRPRPSNTNSAFPIQHSVVAN